MPFNGHFRRTVRAKPLLVGWNLLLRRIFIFWFHKMFSFSGVFRCSSFGVTHQFLYVVYIVLFRLVRILYIIVVYRVRLIVRGVPPTNPSKGRQAFTLARYPSRVRALFHP